MKLLSKTFLFGLAFAWGGLGVLSATVDLANGLVGHWSFDEVNGTTVKDSSGNNRHGTLVNMDSATDYIDGKVNKAIDLDGSNDYISIPHSSALDIRRTISVSMWIKVDSFANEWMPVFYKGSGVTNGRTYALWQENSRYLHNTSMDSSGQEYANTGSIISTGNWYHVVSLFDRSGGTSKIYVNNALSASESVRQTDTVSNTKALLFGWTHESTSNCSTFDGQFDEVRLYDRILNTDEIAYLYTSAATDTDSDGLTDAEEANLGTNPALTDTDGDGFDDNLESMATSDPTQFSSTPLDIDLVGHWKFDESSGTNAADSSGNSNHGTLQGGPTWAQGKVGGALNFDGVNDYVDCGNDASLNVSGTGLSLAAWAKHTFTPGSHGVANIIRKHHSSGHWLRFESNSEKITLNAYGITGIGGDITLSPDTWFHVVGTYDGANVSLFVNGVLDKAVSGSGNLASTSNDQLLIGNGSSGGSEYWKGLIDDVRLYDRALSAEEIAGMYSIDSSSGSPFIVQGASVSVTMSEDGNPTAWSAPSLSAFDSNTSANSLQWSLATSPAHGAATVEGNGSSPTTFSYVPTADYNGSDSFVVQVSDGNLTDSITVNVTVSQVDDVPAFTSLDGNASVSLSHPENVLPVVNLTAIDGDGQSLSYSISGGSDSSLFEINATTNALQFIAYPDYEYPHDSDGNNVYGVVVTVSDGSLTDTQTLTVTVTDSNDTFWTFTNASATGRTGPTQSQVNSAYSGTTLESQVTINTQGIQEWTVPQPGIYRIEVHGAHGGNGSDGGGAGGNGARIVGAFNFQSSTSLKIVVGQQGLNYGGGGGGGASFAWNPSSASYPLVAAGGGGGKGDINRSGGDASFDLSASGSGQGGASVSNDGQPGGGGGWLSAGGGGGRGGSAIRDGDATGGDNGSVDGGFGGGGAEVSSGSDAEGGGGGGGYTGGSATGSDDTGGGGGTSYNAGTHQYSAGGSSSNHGLVVITFVEATNQAPTDLTLSSATVPENQSSGTEIGSFAPTDLDDVNGSGTYSHSLVDGNGSTDNASFTLETNGTLKTASAFDYETKTAYSIRVRVADEHNASYEEAFTISVTDLDDTAPVITLSGDANVTHEAAISYSDAGATWTDAVDGNGSADVSGTVNISVPGTYSLTYSKTDAAGNAATQVTRTVTMVDTTEPVISLSGDANVTHEAATVYTDGGAAWIDTLDGNGSATAFGAVNASVPGTYTLSYDLNDTAGNGATQITRTVIVQDTTKPVITLTGDATVTHEASTSYTDAGAAWTDTLDGNGSLVAVGSVNINVPGVYVLTYDITDAAGNAADRVTRTVTVQDTTNPVITLAGDAAVTHEAATSYSDAGATWTDTLDGNGTLVASGAVSINVLGVYTLTYDFTDAAGNAADQVTRTVTVQDTTKPVITLTGDATVTHEAATAYADAGAAWTDTLDGNGTLVAVGSVNVNAPGAYVLSYDVMDAAGNAADQVTRTVTVVDTTKPVITLTGDASVTHEAATSYSDGGSTWTDTLDGNGTLDTNGTVNPLLPGVYSLAFGVADAAGNAADEVTRTVTVVDTTKPVITLEGNATIRHRVWRSYLDPGARASDTLDGNLTNKITTTNPVDASIPGSYEVSYAVSDAAGNAATVVTRSVVVFNEAPSNLLLSNASIEENLPSGALVGTFSTEDPDDADGSKSYLYAKVSGASLTVSTAGVLRTSEAFDFESSSSHEIVVRTTDEFGAFLEKSFTISVVDAFVPGVDTSPATEVTGTSSVLNGSIADAGDSQGVTERGFVLGRSPDPEASGGSTLEAGAGSGAFSASATNLMPGRVYYFKAYARNAEGISYGSQERFTTPQDRGSALWSAATASGANWRSSDWFGSFYLTDTPWLYHGELGWLYASGTSSSSVWLWTESLGWVWTGKETFPYLYRNFDTGWYHWNGTVNGRSLFYRYSDSQWIDFPLGGNAEAYK